MIYPPRTGHVIVFIHVSSADYVIRIPSDDSEARNITENISEINFVVFILATEKCSH